MNILHMISLPVNVRALRQWAVNRGFAADEGRALHHLLNENFGKSVLQPFRFMVASGARTATIYAYSPSDAETLQQIARDFGAPDALAVCNISQLASKSMPNKWQVGRRLAFDIRVRPVRRLRRPAGEFRQQGAEVDAYLLNVLRRLPKDSCDEMQSELNAPRDQVYAQWLAERFSNAAYIENVTMTSFERSRVLRGERKSEGPDVTFQGELTVRESGRFGQILRSGIGRHKAYGYGMLLLRPPKVT